MIARLCREHPDIEIEGGEVLTNLSRALRDGVLMLPTLMVCKKRFHHAPPLDKLLRALDMYPMLHRINQHLSKGRRLMVAAINHLHRKISVDQIGKIMEQEALVLLKQMPGFEGIDLVKVTNDRGTVILYWDPAADAGNRARTFGATWFAKNITPHLASEQQRSDGKVIVHYRT